MPTTVLICRAAEEDSVLATLMLARSLRDGGSDPVVVFAAGALNALHDGTFNWSTDFKRRDARTRIIAAAEQAAVPLADRTRDPRWSDIRSLIAGIADDPAIRVVACPIWHQLLGNPPIPNCLEAISVADYTTLLNEASTVIGGYA